jgi:histidinol-phosphate aminotransferase
MNKSERAKAPWRLRRLIDALPKTVPFVGPEAQERQRGKPFRARIGANECLFGPSPKAVAAMAEAGREIWKYGDPEGYELRHALAAHHGVKPENIVLGPGIDGLLGYTTRMFVDEGDSVVTSDGAYPTFNFHVIAQGGALHKIPYRDDREDIHALTEKARETNATLIYFSNPDNPMGTWWTAHEVSQMIADLPDGCLLLLDEAYCDYAPEGTVPPIDTGIPNVLRFRTFSKAYGMAGARVGYCIGEETLISEFEKVRDHYGMNRTAEIGAMAALADQEWLAQTARKTAEARERICAIARANGLEPIMSATNFVTLDCGRDSAYARALMEAILARGVFIRMPGVEPLSRCIRISAGLPSDLDIFEEVLPQAIAAIG